MVERMMEIKADSLEEARKQARSQVPEGLKIVSEEILSYGKTRSITGIADTIEAAFRKAESELPSDVEVLEKKQLVTAKQKVVTVEAFDEGTARAQVEKDINKNARVEDVKLKKLGKKGFLGIGKKPDTYEVQMFEPAVVEVKYKKRARIRVELAESPEHWAQKLKEKQDYRVLAAINNSQDYDEPFHWRKRDIANRILREAGTETVDAIIEELAKDGVGTEELSELLVQIGDPEAVPILKKKLDRGEFRFSPSTESDVRVFVEKYQDLIGEVEMVKCALCGKTRPVTETNYTKLEGQVNRFCVDTCWGKRGCIIGSKDGVGCPYYTEDKMCMAGRGEPSRCTFTFKVGPSFTSCYVFRTHPTIR